MLTRLGLASALSALLVTALVGVAGSHAAAADPVYGAPTVGQCFDMSPEELLSNSYTELPVDCAGTNTSQVIAVAPVPDGMTFDLSARLVRVMFEACFPAAREVLDTSTLGLSMTAYSLAWFVPTDEQQAAGARWLRCDLVLRDGKRLAPLPDKLDVGKLPFRKSISRCLVGRDFRTTACTSRHTFRATAAVRVKVTRYPSERRWNRLGSDICRRGVTTPRRYRYTWPSKPAWKAGNHTLVCYSHTRR